MIEFYQFPFSHFCEKARWALDYKGVAYRTVNYLPVFHFIPVRTIAPQVERPRAGNHDGAWTSLAAFLRSGAVLVMP